jgi:hypothetical protein
MNHPVRRVFHVLTAGVVLLLLTACSSTWQYVKLPDQKRTVANPFKGRVYVIRLSGTNAVAPVDVSDGYELIGSTRPHGYLCWERPPGDTTVRSSSDGESEVSFKVTANTVYFIFQRVGPGRFLAESTLEIVNEEEGRAALKDCKPPRMHTAPRTFGSTPNDRVIGNRSATSAPVQTAEGRGPAGGVTITFPH